MLISISFILSPCQWLAVWFWASPLILVCLISPTCKVGITILSTYLPRRGVVRIHGVTFGASNLLEEVWHKHNILFFIVHCMCNDLRAKEFYIQATAATVPWKSGADTTHTKAQSRLCHHSSLWSSLNWNLCWKNLGNIFTNHQQLQMVFNYVYLQKHFSFTAWTTLECCPLLTFECWVAFIWFIW